MQFDIEVLDVGPVSTVPTKGGKSYSLLEVAYKRDGKVEGKKLVDFNNKEVFAYIQTCKKGDHLTVTAEKGEPNAQGKAFWNWTAIEGSLPGVPAEAAKPVASAEQPTTRPQTGRVTGSNYETPEERALRRALDREKFEYDKVRQRLIVRQSNIKDAIAYLIANSKLFETFSISDVLSVAERLEDYVFNGPNNAKEAKVLTKVITQKVYPAEVSSNDSNLAQVKKSPGRPRKTALAVEGAAPVATQNPTGSAFAGMEDDIPF